jgi:hypothetical protein
VNMLLLLAGTSAALLAHVTTPQGAQQPEPRRVDWVDWSDRFIERGRTEKERELRRYIVKLKGVSIFEAIRYLPEREERLSAEREKAIPILLELLGEVLPMASRGAVDGLNSTIPCSDLERLAQRDAAAFKVDHMELIHRLIKDNGLHYGDQQLLPLVAILRRRESIPHLAWLLGQPGRAHGLAIRTLQEIGHPDAIPHLRSFAERNPDKALWVRWATLAIGRIEIDNLPSSERLRKWEAAALALASEEAFEFKVERLEATWDEARWVLSRLAEHGEWRHAEVVLRLQAAARSAKDNSVNMAAEKAYQALVEKLPLQERLAIWESILKEATDRSIRETRLGDERAVWAAQGLLKEGGQKYLGLFEEMLSRKGLFETVAAPRLRQEVEQAITRLKEDRR